MKADLQRFQLPCLIKNENETGEMHYELEQNCDTSESVEYSRQRSLFVKVRQRLGKYTYK